MKVVIDTNVYIAAFMASGQCERVVRSVWKYHHAMVSVEILEECEKTLRKKLHITAQKTKKVCRMIQRNGRVLTDVEVPPKRITRDRMDDHIIALGLHSDADAIVTGDHDLLILKKYHGIPIVAPNNFWSFEQQYYRRTQRK